MEEILFENSDQPLHGEQHRVLLDGVVLKQPVDSGVDVLFEDDGQKGL